MPLLHPLPACGAGHQGLHVHLRRGRFQAVPGNPFPEIPAGQEPHAGTGPLQRLTQGNGGLHVSAGTAGNDGNAFHV